MDIKPIETEYNGYRFRSRLEARWAVFFDSLKIKYEYEQEGFQLPNGKKYLPDFYLPEEEYYIEVKGDNDHLYDDLQRIAEFVQYKCTSVMILSNIPYDPHSKGLFLFPIMYFVTKHGGYVIGEHAFFMTHSDGTCFIQDDFYIGTNQYFFAWKDNTLSQKQLFDKLQAIKGSDHGVDDDEYPVRDAFDLTKVEQAFSFARKARFEHGEKPILGRL